MTDFTDMLSKAKEMQNKMTEYYEYPDEKFAGSGSNTAIENISRGAKSGETYEKYNPRRTHKASAPGEAPASDTGNLVSQIRVKAENKDLFISAQVNTK